MNRSQQYIMSMGTSCGLLVGVVLGVIFNNLALWVGIGRAIWATIAKSRR